MVTKKEIQRMTVTVVSGLRAKILVGTAWVLSLVFAIPELVLFRVGTQFGGPMCMIDFTQAWQWQVGSVWVCRCVDVCLSVCLCVWVSVYACVYVV